MYILKDVLLIFMGAAFAYIFDLFRRFRDREKAKQDELNKRCNELVMTCDKLYFLTKKCFQNFTEYHYYKEICERNKSKDSVFVTMMLMSKKYVDDVEVKIDELSIIAVYCIDEIHRISKTTDFEDSRAFFEDYKPDLDKTAFNDIPEAELEQKLKDEYKKDDEKSRKFKSDFEEIKTKARSLK